MAWSHVKQVLNNDNLRRAALFKTVSSIVTMGLIVVLFEYWNARTVGAYPHYWMGAAFVAVGFPIRLNVVATQMVAPKSRLQRIKLVLVLWAILLLSFVAVWFFLQPS
jgi:hypothetical protein